jgi:exopolysaccharide production protein ExoQ
VFALSLLAAWVAIGIVCIALTLQATWLLELTRDPKLLTGRTQIWQPMIISFLESPFSGSGYGAFWEAGVGATKIGPLAGVTQGHNGYLDLAVQIGLPGLLLALGALVLWPILLIIKLRSRAYQLCSLAAAVLVFFLINNGTESSVFDGDQLLQVFWMVMLAALVSAGRRQDSARSGKRMKGERSGYDPQLKVRPTTGAAVSLSHPVPGTIKRKRRTAATDIS